jgi:hypothetical protein
MKAAAVVTLAVAALLATAARAEEKYSNDDLCRAIGETRAAALQPRDRLFFEKNCVCFEPFGCMEKGGAKAKEAVVALAKLDEQRRQDAETEKARKEVAKAEQARKAAASAKRARAACQSLNETYWTCARTPGRECDVDMVALHNCCVDAGVRNQSKCLALFP